MDRGSARSPRWLGALAIVHLLLGLSGAAWVATLLRFLASAIAAVPGLEDSEPAAGTRSDAMAALVGSALGLSGPLIWAGTQRIKARRDFSALLTTKARSAGALAIFMLLAVCWRAKRRVQRASEQPMLPPRFEEPRPRRRLDESAEPPELYVRCCGSRDVATARWQRTMAWRREQGAERVLREPQPAYHAIKNRLYPHHLHGRTLAGEVVMWELLGSLDTSVLRNGEVSQEAAFRHFVFVHEFISQKYEGEETRLVTVLDVAGLRFAEVNSFLIKLVSTTSRVVENLVPFRASRIFVVNAPSWFGAVWGGIRRALPTEIRHKVQVLGPDFADRLEADLEAMPAEYGGQLPLGQHPDELAMLEAATRLNSGADIEDLLPQTPQTPVTSQQQHASTQPQDITPLESQRAVTTTTTAVSRRLPWHLLRLGQPRSQVTRAHLGDDAANRVHYDAQRQQWVFEDEDAEDDGEEDALRPTRSSRRRQVEATDSDSEDERALVAAIEAATLRRSLASDPQALRAYVHSQSASEQCSGLQAGLVAGLCLSRFSRTFLAVAVWPWLLAPASRGGLGLRVGDASVCCSAGVLCLMAVAARCSEPLRRMPRDAPLRAFRVAAGGSFLVAVAAPELAPSLGGGVGTTGELPRDSSTVYVVASVACAALLLFSHMAAAAAGAAVKLSDRDSLAVAAARLFGDLSGPPAAAALVHAALSTGNARFPFNASAALSAVALLNALLYLLSFLVYKKVVGDVAGARATCAACFELPARDLQRCECRSLHSSITHTAP